MMQDLLMTSASFEFSLIPDVELSLQSQGAPNLRWKVVPLVISVAAIPDKAVASAILSCFLAYANKTLHKNVLPLPPGASIVYNPPVSLSM